MAKSKTIHIDGWFKPYVTPPIPDASEILGFKLPKKEQKWENCRPYLPSDEEAEAMTKEERIKFISKELERRVYGCWFMNNGEPTYLTGDYYFYLTYWFIGALTDTGLPEYREANRDWMYVVDECEKDANCFGTILLTMKRCGKTERHLSILYNRATTIDENCLFGMQSLNATEAKKNLFIGRLMRSHKRIPNWLKPVSNDTTGTKAIVSELTFMGEKLDGGKYKEGLNNVIDWRPTIPTAYQGKRPRQIFIDEPGSIDEMDLLDWWTTVKEQLALGKRVFGRAYLPTTLEDMKKKGGPLFAKIWDDSDPMQRDDNGRTRSGLYRYFKPFWHGREGFIDEYGNSLREEAEKFRDNQLKHATVEGARKIRRQYPATIEEAFDVVLSDFWEEDVKDILKQSYLNSIDFPGIEYVKLVYYGTQLLVSPVKEQDAAVKVVQRPKQGVKYGIGIDSIGTDNQTGDEGGSSLAVVVTKGFDLDEYAYTPVCSFILRPDKMEDAYAVVANMIRWYGAEAGKDLLKAIGETNAGATNLLNYLINQGLKQFMAPKPKSIGVASGAADQAQSDKYWLYRTDDVKEYQRLLANRFLRKNGHKIRIKSLVQSLLDCGLRNADEADAFLMGLILFQDFDAVTKETKKRSYQKWDLRWNPDKCMHEWELVNC